MGWDVNLEGYLRQVGSGYPLESWNFDRGHDEHSAGGAEMERWRLKWVRSSACVLDRETLGWGCELGPTHSWLCSWLPTDRGRVPLPILPSRLQLEAWTDLGFHLTGCAWNLETSKFRVLHMLNTDSKYSFSIYGNSLTSNVESYDFIF